MNMINEMCLNILVNNGKEKESISSNYKKYLKQLILENLPALPSLKTRMPTNQTICAALRQRNAFDWYC